jgi:hypothetical protein
MTCMLQFIKTAAVALPFGMVIASIEPYPHTHELQVFAAAAAFFLVVAALLKPPQGRRVWLAYGFATIVCYVLPFLWFWWGAMPHGWWYPPQPPLIQQVFLVDGESSYDAMVGNLFLVFWLITSLGFAIHHLIRRTRKRTARSASPSHPA